MTNNLPNYATYEVPDGKPPEEYDHHERRAEVWRLLVKRGGPTRLNKSKLADRYDVARSTIYRDLDRLGESVAEHIGDDAEVYTRAIFEDTVEQLRAADDWRAIKAAWDVVMDWNDWLAEIGEQHREPSKAELDVRSRHAEVAYQIIREGDDEPLPTIEVADGEERVDYEALGFTSSPSGSVEVEAVDDVDGGRDE